MSESVGDHQKSPQGGQSEIECWYRVVLNASWSSRHIPTLNQARVVFGKCGSCGCPEIKRAAFNIMKLGEEWGLQLEVAGGPAQAKPVKIDT